MNTNSIRPVEEAIFLLRRLTLREWLPYLLAAVPFLLLLLQFVRDMSDPLLAGRCALDSLLCTAAFFWASAWKARFGATLLETMNEANGLSERGGFWHALYLQSILQTLKLIFLPFAALSVLPLAWTSLFFRHATIEAGLVGGTLGSVIAKSARRASMDTRANWVGIFILVVLGVIVFLNVYTLLAVLPMLLRMFSGIETAITRNTGSLFGFNVFSVVVAVTWLLVDPLVLAYAAVRCFYSEARTDGRDLLAKLRPVAAAAALLLLLFVPCQRVSAQHPSAHSVSKDDVSRALQKAVTSDDYGWLRIRQQTKQRQDPFIESINQAISDFFKKLDSLWAAFRNWLRRTAEKNGTPSGGSISGRPPSGDIRWLLYVLAGVVLAAAFIVIWKSGVKSIEPNLSSSRVASAPDLDKNNVLASDLPEEEWLRLAREFLAQGESRLAVRALYLSNLSYLGSQRFIQIARSKSNAIYERELRRSPHGGPVSTPFAESNRGFEQVWYGFHEATPEMVAALQRDGEAIRQNAKT